MAKALRHFSIRRRVLTLAVLLLACAGVVLLLFLRGYAQEAANKAFDRLLAASALSLAGSVQTEDSQVVAELPTAAFAMLSGHERVFYVVRDMRGHLVTGYDDLDAGMPLADNDSPQFSDLRYRGETLRIATVGRLVSVGGQTGWVTIRTAETQGARQELAAEILNRSTIPLVVLSAVALALLWFGIQHAFAPLRLISQELRTRKPSDLQALRSPAPREVRTLVEALNVFMARLQGIMSSLNNLVADAAHQVRTPLASLRAQAEVSLDENDPEKLQRRLLRIHANATHASQLVNQFLMDATITHRLGMREQASVAIVEIINDTRRRLAPDDAPRLRIHLSPELRRARVWGDRLALREMLRNVVDNALRYAPRSEVHITAQQLSGPTVMLQVTDAGPGLTDAEKSSLLARFVRGATAGDQPGSGLGLAIVDAVVRSHQGQLVLVDAPGGGLQVQIHLPMHEHETICTRRNLVLAGGLAVVIGPQVWRSARAASAQDALIVGIESFPAVGPRASTLVIAGPTDRPVFRFLARSFQELHPDIAIEYREIGSRELYQQAVHSQLDDVDVLISSAVDMQLRLANDGYALDHHPSAASAMPPWAIWRSEVFGFTFEPIVMVYNQRYFSRRSVPRSRRALLDLLETEKAALRHRVGTYDIAASSLGHLLATLDEQVSSNFWGLMNAFGQVGVQLEVSTGDILDKIQTGELVVGYNVLGSYALTRQAQLSELGIIIPEDYMLVLSRAALIPRTAPNPMQASRFIDWLLSSQGQTVVDSQGLGRLIGLDRHESSSVFTMSHGTAQPVALRPVLLAGLDQQRKARFLKNWTRLVTDTP